MKLLLKKQDIDKAKAQERKLEIDQGLSLARSVDKLREARQTEEKNLLEFRATAVKQVQGEIDFLTKFRDDLVLEIKRQREARAELLIPLDKEWKEVNQEKESLTKEKESLFISKEQLKIEETKIENERKKISEIVSKVTQNEKDTEKSKDEASSLKELAQREYEMAREEHIFQRESEEKALIKLTNSQREYEVAMSVIQIRENEVKEKEVELISREKHLATQQVALRIAKEVINKNANLHSSSNEPSS